MKFLLLNSQFPSCKLVCLLTWVTEFVCPLWWGWGHGLQSKVRIKLASRRYQSNINHTWCLLGLVLVTA